MMNYFPDEVMEHVFDYVTSHRDRNAMSLVCKNWHRLERCNRKSVFIGNCYSISPERMIERFPGLKFLTLKGKPHFADFNLVPHGWGGFVYPWIEALAKSRVELEELRLKRMVVTDESLELLSRSFFNFRSLVLVSCDGFTTDGLAAIAANCRFLKELDLQENVVDDFRGQWLSCFPDCCTSLVSLNFACLKGEINLGVLERLVARSPNLKSLRLNRALPLDALQRILMLAPQLYVSLSGHLTDQVFLYIGMYAEQLEMLSLAFAGESDKGMLYVLNGCKKLRKLVIRDNPFGNMALLTDVGKYETIQSLWMSSCDVTIGACRTLAKKMPRLNVEIFNENEQADCSVDDGQSVEMYVYVYRTLVGKRKDAPEYVWTL